MRNLHKYVGGYEGVFDKISIDDYETEMILETTKRNIEMTMALYDPYPDVDDPSARLPIVNGKTFTNHIYVPSVDAFFNSSGWMRVGNTNITHSPHWRHYWGRDVDDLNNKKLPVMITNCKLYYGVYAEDPTDDIGYVYHICDGNITFSKEYSHEIKCADMSKWREVYKLRDKIIFTAEYLLENERFIRGYFTVRKHGTVRIDTSIFFENCNLV